MAVATAQVPGVRGDSVRPVLFLDFDGVLNSQEHWARRIRVAYRRDGTKARMACRAHVDVLNDVVRQTLASVVVSSSWRCGMTVHELRTLLRGSGFLGRVRGKTPDRISQLDASCLNRSRGDEIQDWLTASGHRGPFAIVDDDADMEHLSSRLVQTTFERGLTRAHVEPLVALLRSAP